MTSQSSIMEEMGTLFDEMIHVMPGFTVHLHGHWNKMVPFMKPFTFVDVSNGIKFHICTY